MVMAAAGAFLKRMGLREALGSAFGDLTGAQPSRARHTLRIAALVAAGGFAMAAPLATLAVAAVVAGTLLLALALHDLVALVASNLGTSAPGPTPHFNPALAVGLTCVVVAAAAEAGSGFECNESAALCGRRLDEITFPGAHNAMGVSDNPRWMFPNQDAGMLQLLHLGVRAFMLDVWKGHPVADRIKTDFQSEEQRRKFEVAIGPEAFAAAMRIRDRLVGEGGETGLYMCHGFCELGAASLDSALAQLTTFLAANPSDVVLLIIEDYVPPADIAAAFERQGLMSFVYTGPSRGPFPTLRELITANQRVFVMGEHETGGLAWYHPAFEVMQETPYTFHAPREFSCKSNRGDRTSPIFLMNHWIETTPAPRPSNAKLVNAEAVLLQRAKQCRRLRGKVPNVIAVDFAATGDVVHAAAVLNGLERPLPPHSIR
jgi:hypothetical protein